jgi:hypothetical protein
MPLVVLIPENKTVLRAEDDLGLSLPFNLRGRVSR